MSRNKNNKSPNKENNYNIAVIIAFIGLAGTVITAYFGFRANTEPTAMIISATQTAQASISSIGFAPTASETSTYVDETQTNTPDFPSIPLCNQLSGSDESSQINLNNFSGNEKIETFNPNFGRKLSPVTFHGLTFTSSPDTELWSDIEWGHQFDFSYFPDASGGYALNDSVGRTNLRIDFTSPVQRVGILVATTYITTYMMTACDDKLDLLGSVVATTPFENGAIFLGLQSTSNIRRIFITEPFNNTQITIFDDLHYEPIP